MIAADSLAASVTPLPAAAAYFGTHYQELGADPMKYGYYQFRFMADALRMREQLDFAKMAARTGSRAD